MSNQSLTVHADIGATKSSLEDAQQVSKRKKSSSSKKAKKQMQHGKKVAHTNINDWSSDDSADAGPVPLADQLNPMSESDSDVGRIEADVTTTGRPASASAPSKKQLGQNRQAKNSKPKGGSSKGDKQKKSEKKKSACDWTSDDSSDAQPSPLPDQLDSMSDSESDSHAANVGGKVVAGADSRSARMKSGPQNSSKQVMPEAAPQGTVPKRGGAPDAADTDASPGQQKSAGQQQQAKRKGRLRKARASPEQDTHAVAAGAEAEDIMVDLDDDVPGLEEDHQDASAAGINMDSADSAQMNQSSQTVSRHDSGRHKGGKRKSEGAESSRATHHQTHVEDSERASDWRR